MKNPLHFLIIMLFFASVSVSTAAPAANGKIIDILDNGIVTLKFASSHSYKTSDTLELTYMAGSLPMAIGNYEVITTSKNVCLAKPLIMSMPPSLGMTVRVTKTQHPGQSAIPMNSKVSGLKGQALTTGTSAALANEPVEIIGTVIAVNGDNITVIMIGQGDPRIGWFIDLFYVTTQGKELPVGTWKVQSLAGKKLTAVKIKGMGNANKQLKAVIYSHKEQTAMLKSASITPQNAGAVPAPFANSRANTLSTKKTAASKPIQLLGQTAPTVPKKKIAANPFKKTSSLPPGVTKKTASTSKKKKNSSRTRDPETARLLKLLTAKDLKSKRTAAKLITRKPGRDPILYERVNKELLKGYQSARDKLEVDTMAWLCKALASSKKHKYYETIDTVARKAKNRKLKKYAKKSLQQLK